LVPVRYRTKPGNKTVKVVWKDKDGKHSRSLVLAVKAGQFKQTVLKVTPGKVNISKKNLARIKQERREIAAAYAKGSMRPLWKESFLRPVPGIITSPYGRCRIMNGQVRSYHGGVDFRAAAGTQVAAANAGVVRLAKDLFFSGNAVIIDHGGKLFTVYAHLSRIDVTVGKKVARGEIIGLTGKTGRVTGPHLHWGVKICGIAVNPMDFMDATDSLFK
jgi:murein DD-endopeptidase MepM/ murein hydrolase activator NlpD